ncbi:glycerate kinase [Arthrobacter sp. UYP6]|uniref:glycerate kinase n=1 Tax=Arthrobacter sp. UYP6 TaxID=1756378 RepID=UPI003391173B
MRIVIAPDKFKGSLSASQVAFHLGRGIHAVLPDAEIVAVPVADGGEGTLDAAVGAGYERAAVAVSGPTGEPLTSAFARRGHQAVVEMAAASGLDVLPGGVFDAGGATSFGTGELIRAALDAGCTEIVLGVGGSACTDGGAGLLQALGAVFTDDDGASLPRGGLALAHVSRIDLTGLDPRLGETRLVLAGDVDNPLLGARGAAAVFAPQKGASAAVVGELDAALRRYVEVLAQTAGDQVWTAAEAPGAGAAGGVGFAALALLGAKRRPGIDVVLELTGLADHIRSADLVITGEGSLDEQSLGGKTPLGVARQAAAHGVPVVAVCGRTTLTNSALAAAGFLQTYALTEIERDTTICMTNAGPLLEQLGQSLGAYFEARHRLGAPTKEYAE